MIPLGGLGTFAALRLVEATRGEQTRQIENDALNKRQIEAFRERVGEIESPADLVKDQEVYTFVMRAFDLEDQIFGKAMIRKMLESDITDREGLVNRLTDPRFREMHKAFDFGPNGPTAWTWSKSWQDDIIARFTERQLINEAGEQSEGTGIALEFKSRAGDIKTWFDVLKNRDVSQFMRTALGMPSSMASLDIDRQAAMFDAKFDLAKFQDPREVDRLVARFSAVHDAVNGTAALSSPVLTLMQGAVSAGQGGGFTPVTIDIAPVLALGQGARYRG